MPWQPAESGTIAQDDSGAYQVKVGDTWVPAPKGSVAKNDEGKFQFNSDALAPPKPAPTPAPPPPAAPEATPALTQIGHMGMDAAGTVARGVGALGDVVHNAYGALTDGDVRPYDAPNSLGNRFAAPFQHAPDVQGPIQQATSAAATMLNPAGAALHALPYAAQQAGQAVENSGPLGQTVMQDVVPPVRDMASAAATVEGARSAASMVGKGLDIGINKLSSPGDAGQATIDSNPKIAQARQAGFKLTGNDVRNAVNAPDSDIPGLTRQNMADDSATDTIQRNNRALATQSMAQDVKLGNTRAIQDDQVQARMKQEGKVYDQVGAAIGEGRAPTTELMSDLDRASNPGASPASRAEVQQQVDFYRDHFKDGFSGQDAVSTTRQLRADAYKQMASEDPDTQALGKTNLNIANAIENEMMRQLPVQYQSLKDAFPAARQQLAKLHEISEVSEGGQVNAQKVLQIKRAGAPLTGASADVANAADVAPESMAQAVGPDAVEVPIGHYGVLRAVKQIGGKVIRTLPGMDPTTEAFQTSNYGPTGKPPVATPEPPAPPRYEMPAPPGTAGRNPPVQPDLPLGPPREHLELTQPEGTAPQLSRPVGQRELDLPPPGRPKLDLTQPEGPPAYEPEQRGMHLPEGTPPQGVPENLAVGQGKAGKKMSAAERKAYDEGVAAALRRQK